MKQYIERDAAIRTAIQAVCAFNIAREGVGITQFDAVDVANRMEMIPAADVVERVRGEWVQTTEPLTWHEVDCVKCSACGETWATDDEFDFEDFCTWQKFCPNCGADMRKENEDAAD